MKNIVVLFFLFFVFTAVLAAAGRRAPAREIAKTNLYAVPGANQSEIYFNFPQGQSSNNHVFIYINKQLVAQCAPQTETDAGRKKVIVPNGRTTVELSSRQWIPPEFDKEGKKITDGYWVNKDRKNLNLSADSNSITVDIETDANYNLARYQVKDIQAIPSQVVIPAETAQNTNQGIEQALESAAAKIVANVSKQNEIAIVYITSHDKNLTDYIAGELEYILVSGGYIITDRSQLDKIRTEQNLQMSGEIDDASAVSIGKILGAHVILTGKIDGEGSLRRLRIRALNVENARVVSVASEPF
jgi:hypothetical protein